MLFFGLLIFIFLQIIRPQDFVVGLTDTRLVLYLMVILLFVLLFNPIEKKLFRSPQDKFAGVFFLSWFFSVIGTFWITQIVDTAIETFKFVLMYYCIVIIIDSEVKLKVAIWTMVILMAIVGLMGILQYHGYNITGAQMSFSQDKGVWQIKGIGNFDNPNDMAYSVVLVTPFALSLLFQYRGFLGRFGGLVLLGISVYCIYLTRSRGGQVAFAVCLFSWTYFWLRNPKLRRRILILGIVGVLAVAIFQATGYREDESSMGRIEAWAEGWQLLRSHPLLGVGKGNFGEYHKLDTHNSFVRAGTELGLFGLYCYVGMLYGVGLTIKRLQEPSVEIRWRTYYAALGSFFFSYVAGSAFSTRTYDLVFLLCVALVGALGRVSLKDTAEVSVDGVLFPDETTHVWNKNIFGLTIAVLIAWYLFLRQVW